MAFEQNVKRYFFADASVPLHAFRCSLVRLMKFWLWSKLFAECIVAELTVSFDPKSRKKKRLREKLANEIFGVI